MSEINKTPHPHCTSFHESFTNAERGQNCGFCAAFGVDCLGGFHPHRPFVQNALIQQLVSDEVEKFVVNVTDAVIIARDSGSFSDIFHEIADIMVTLRIRTPEQSGAYRREANERIQS